MKSEKNKEQQTMLALLKVAMENGLNGDYNEKEHHLAIWSTKE